MVEYQMVELEVGQYTIIAIWSIELEIGSSIEST